MANRPLIAFVGLLAPPEGRRDNPAFSQAGTMMQESLLGALVGAGVDVDRIFAQRPVPSFPRVRKLLFATRFGTLAARPVTFIPFINFGAVKTISSGIALFAGLSRWAWITRRSPQRAILTYNLTSPPGIASVIVGRVTGVRVIAIIADVQVPGSGSVANSFLRRMDYRLHTATIALCDALVVLTARMATDFAPNTPFILVEGAVPADMASAYTLADKGSATPSTGSETILMFAGELSELKGVAALLNAFALNPEPALRLWITGRGPDQARVEAAIAADSRITYWGYPPYSDLLDLYRRATILVNPHSVRYESARYLFPSKLIEYLATGTPVITTCSTPEVREEYGAHAYIAAADTAEALASTIDYVIRRPRSELAAKGASAREFVLREKTWEVQGKRIAAFLRDVLTRDSIRD